MKGCRIWAEVIMGLCLLLCAAVSEAADLPVTSPFGWREHPITGEWKFHSGVDLGYDYGTIVPALFSGTVVEEGNFSDGYGNHVTLYHPDYNTYTKYCHLAEIYVETGQAVVQGQGIGAVGSTGNSTGPHLHLEYIVWNPDTGEYEFADPLTLWP